MPITSKKTLADLNLEGKKVFVRVDFNVPLRPDGTIEDDTRIRAALPTIKFVLTNGGIPILASHLGRPKGKVDPKYRMDPVSKRLAELLEKEVYKLGDCVGPEIKSAIDNGKRGDVFLLENLRFHPGETKNDGGFAGGLADLADVYINDAFGASHRAHASIVGVPERLPAGAGLLLEKEIQAFDSVLNEAKHPFTAILGGAKVSDKIGVITNLLKICDVVLIGGGMAYTFLKAQDLEVGKSLCEDDKLDLATEIIKKAKARFVEFQLPTDHVVADRFAADAKIDRVSGAIPADMMGLDIGERTQREFAYWIGKSRTVVWNGPMGVYEMDPFRAGTQAVAQAVSDFGGYSIVGGGDSVAALEALGLSKRISHISTGGGASLEMLEGKELPGIAALSDKE